MIDNDPIATQCQLYGDSYMGVTSRPLEGVHNGMPPLPLLPPLPPPSSWLPVSPYPFPDERFNTSGTPPMPQTVMRGVQEPPGQTQAVRQLLEFINVDFANTRVGGTPQLPNSGWLSFERSPPMECPTYEGCGVTVTVEGVSHDFQLTEDDIGKVFQRYGDLRVVRVLPPDNSVAQVYFFSQEAAQNAIAGLDGKILNGVHGVLRVVSSLYPFTSRLDDYTQGEDRTNGRVDSNSSLAPIVHTPLLGVSEGVMRDDTVEGRENGYLPGSNLGPSEKEHYNRLLTEWDVENFLDGVSAGGMKENSTTVVTSAQPVDLASDDRTSSGGHSGNKSAAMRGPPSTEICGRNEEKMEEDILKSAVHAPEDASPRAAIVANSAGKSLLGDGTALTRDMPRSVSGGSGTVPRATTPGELSVRKYTCRFDIGIENDKEFQVARRIIGQKGANMKRIVSMSNAKLRLRGRGSGYLEGAARVESPDPLHLCISCLTKEGYEKAVAESANLLEKVYSDWREFNIRKHRGNPGYLKLHMKEQFLFSGKGADGPQRSCWSRNTDKLTSASAGRRVHSKLRS